MQAREAAKKEARQKAIEKFGEIQTAKAAEKAKEAERQKKAQKLPSAQAKAVAPRVSAITSNKMNSFEADLGHSTNPFDERDFSFSSEDGTNPFLDDIRAASAAASALSYGGNPFEETPSIGGLSSCYNCTEDLIETTPNSTLQLTNESQTKRIQWLSPCSPAYENIAQCTDSSF